MALVPVEAAANLVDWQVCDLAVLVDEHAVRARQTIRTHNLDVPADCPANGFAERFPVLADVHPAARFNHDAVKFF